MSSATRIIGNLLNPTLLTRGDVLRGIHESFLAESILMSWKPEIPTICAKTESESGFGNLRKVVETRSFTNFFLYLEATPDNFRIMLDLGLEQSDLLEKVGQNIADKLVWKELNFTENENTYEPIWVNLLDRGIQKEDIILLED